MRRVIIRFLIATLLITPGKLFAQKKGEFVTKYYINQKDDKQKMVKNKRVSETTNGEEFDVHFKIKDSVVIYKAGWIVTKDFHGKSIQYVVKNDSIVHVKVDSIVDRGTKWVAGEISHTDDEPDKLYLNPWTFSSSTLADINTKGYIKIPTNSSIVLTKTFFKVSPVTIPFVKRTRLNDTIGSQGNSDLNLGVGLSFNVNRVKFKNRRLKAKSSAKGISIGTAFGLSNVNLTKDNTSLFDNPLITEENGLVFMSTIGIGINLQYFSFTIFGGYDLPLTSNINKWNYFKKPYMGIGFGVNLSTFGALTN